MMRSLVLGLVLGLISSVSYASNEDVDDLHVARVQLSDAGCQELLTMYSEMQEVYYSKRLGYVPVNPLQQQIRDYLGLETWVEKDGNWYTSQDLQVPEGAGLKMVRALSIELPMDTIRNVYRQFGVLQLRPFNGKSLLIGCGNGPVEPNYRDEVHQHQEYDTINPELSMNPTIVAAFAINNLRGLLPCEYTKVTYEGIDPMGSETALVEFKHHFSKAKVYDIDHSPVFKENLYGSIEEMLVAYRYSYQENSLDSWDDELSQNADDACPLCKRPGGCDCPE